ncbi:hypothetical protein AAG570_008854, partial [Ranatra chinensis]
RGDEEVQTLEEARKVIKELRDRQRLQAHQLLTWRRRVKAQEDQISRMNQEKNDQLKKLSTQLLLFEARLCRKQREIGVLLSQREAVIAKQAKTIKQLQNRLGIEPSEETTNVDSLNDSDSAVIMEEEDTGPTVRRVARSVSDLMEPQGKYSPLRRSNGFLRRPEVLETVYSVEEDADADTSPQDDEQSCSERGRALRGRLGQLGGSFERFHEPPNHVTASYNRVMSNHRSVTKPKDVKYKRINKAKSKSLEELRGRLKNWVEKGNKIAISLDHSAS